LPEVVTCNLCGGSDTDPVCTLADYRFRTDSSRWTIVRCKHCGLGYLNPRPTADEMGAYYPSAYYSYRHNLRDRYERQAEFVPGEGGRLLDLGTATGEFLSVMKQRGWDAHGIEAFTDAESPQFESITRAHFPDEAPLPDDQFDVVTAWAVFEHLHDPAQAFAECRRMLKPGGQLIIQVPNLEGTFGHGAVFEDLPRHLYFFSERTLRHYAAKHGLDFLGVEHTPSFYSGSGRGILRLAVLRSLNRSRDEFFEMNRTPRRERFRRWPLLSVAWTATAAVERVVLADWLVRRAKISRTILAYFKRPDTEGSILPGDSPYPVHAASSG
jgi:SAM-dependent methyltransferase